MMRSIRIDYHQKDLGALLQGTVFPVLRAVGGQRLFAVRCGWAHGPHVLMAPGSEPSDALLASLITPIQHWMAAHPSRSNMSSDDYDAMAASLSFAEGLQQPPPGLRSDNSITTETFDPQPLLGEGQLSGLDLAFDTAAFDWTAAILAKRLSCRSEALISLCRSLLVFVDLGERRYDFWPIAMRAHALSYLNAYPERAGRLTDRVLQLFEQVRPADLLSPSPEADDLRSALSVAEGRLDVVDDAMAKRQAGGLMRSPGPASSIYPPDRLAVAFGRKEHLRYRLLTNLVYARLPVIGLSATDRVVALLLTAEVIRKERPELEVNAQRALEGMMRSDG
jgi:hypothetical protein